MVSWQTTFGRAGIYGVMDQASAAQRRDAEAFRLLV
jgi:hypothetical protein